MFKEGTFIRNIETNEIGLVNLYSEESNYPNGCYYVKRADETTIFDQKKSILWEPREGELCWFWNKKQDLTLQKFHKMDASYFIVSYLEKFKFDGAPFFDVTEKAFKYCEPFIFDIPLIHQTND